MRASGPVGFLNDANAHNEQFEPTLAKRGIGRGLEIDRDENPAANKVLREIDLSPLEGR